MHQMKLAYPWPSEDADLNATIKKCGEAWAANNVLLLSSNCNGLEDGKPVDLKASSTSCPPNQVL